MPNAYSPAYSEKEITKMKVALFLTLLFVVCAVGVKKKGLTLAEPCDAEACKLPDCRCSGTDIPGGLKARDTPQFVLVTFDDTVNDVNIETYRRILYNRLNINQCSAGATFFVNHEWNNYQLVNELYNQGFEIALHSVSHRTNLTFWQQATYEEMVLEFGDQKMQMSHFANIPYEELKGVRIPYLQMTGNASFQVMANFGLVYDSSWGTINYIDPGLWPYTLDYASTQECWVPPCPTASIPGVWVSPMVGWLDLNGNACTMVDYCLSVPPLTDVDAWSEFILQNFERHYMGNRSPFGFYIHETYLAAHPAVEAALVKFMDTINQLNDVFMVNAADVIEWVKDPVPVNEYKQKPCRTLTPTPCPAQNCGPLAITHVKRKTSYWMPICNVCPRVYPWLGNPLGL